LKIQVLYDLSRRVCSCGRFKDRNVFILGPMILWNIRNKPNQATQCHISADWNLQQHSCEKLKCRILAD